MSRKKFYVPLIAMITVMSTIAFVGIAAADNIANTIDTTVDPTVEVVTITAGSSTIVGYVDTTPNGAPSGDLSGCNSTGSSPSYVTLTVPAGVTASANPVTIAGCDVPTPVTFSSNTPNASGYTISVASVSGGRSGSLWVTTGATWKLIVDPAAPTNNAPTKPGKPGLSAGSTPNNTGAFTLSWTASTDSDGDSITYTLEHKDANDASFSQVATGIIGNSYEFGGSSGHAAEGEGTWVYRVKAFDGTDYSVYSDTSDAVVVDQTNPNAPTGSAGTPDYTGDGGWYADSATVVWTSAGDPNNAADGSPGSGVDPATVGPNDVLTAGGTATDTVLDLAGNESAAGSVSVQVDASAPTFNCGTLPTGWQSANVTLNCTAADAGSGLDGSSPAAFQLSTSVASGDETAGASTGTRQLCDNVGHCVTAGPYTFDVDLKAPQLSSCESPDGLWHASDVTLKCTYTDGGSGPATQDVSLSTNVAAGTETSNAIASANGAQACDNVSNCATSPADIGGNKVDKKAPTISITSPTATTYTKGQVVAAAYTCTDGGSLVASCTGTVANGANIDTSSIGSKTFTVNATDNVGNTATPASVTYNVIWDWNGFFRPVDNKDGNGNYILNSVKAGSAIPVKFSLGGDQGLNIMAAGYPKSQVISCSSTAEVDGIEETVTAGGSSLTYDATAGQYIYVWKTDKLWAGTCRQLVVTLADGTVHRASFKLNKF